MEWFRLRYQTSDLLFVRSLHLTLESRPSKGDWLGSVVFWCGGLNEELQNFIWNLAMFGSYGYIVPPNGR